MSETVNERINEIKWYHGAYDLDTAFTEEEWLDIVWAARERGVSVHSLVHDAVTEDLNR